MPHFPVKIMSVEEYLMGRDGKDKREAKEVVMEFYAKNAKRVCIKF